MTAYLSNTKAEPEREEAKAKRPKQGGLESKAKSRGRYRKRRKGIS